MTAQVNCCRQRSHRVKLTDVNLLILGHSLLDGGRASTAAASERVLGIPKGIYPNLVSPAVTKRAGTEPNAPNLEAMFMLVRTSSPPAPEGAGALSFVLVVPSTLVEAETSVMSCPARTPDGGQARASRVTDK